MSRFMALIFTALSTTSMAATAQTIEDILARLNNYKPELNMSATALSIASLHNDETLRIEAIYAGCFHHDTTAFEFTPTSIKHIDIDSAYISSEQVELLDRYFAYLAKLKNSGGCTSSNTYTLKVMRGEAVVREQTVTDATCGFGDLTHGLPYLTPEHLVAKIALRQN